MAEQVIGGVFAGLREFGTEPPLASAPVNPGRVIDEALCEFQRGHPDDSQSEQTGEKSEWLTSQLASLATWGAKQRDLGQETKERVDAQAVLFKIVDKPAPVEPALRDRYGQPYRGFRGDPQNASKASLNGLGGRDTTISVADWYTPNKPAIIGSRPA
jgi:hypothetical protein